MEKVSNWQLSHLLRNYLKGRMGIRFDGNLSLSKGKFNDDIEILMVSPKGDPFVTAFIIYQGGVIKDFKFCTVDTGCMIEENLEKLCNYLEKDRYKDN